MNAWVINAGRVSGAGRSSDELGPARMGGFALLAALLVAGCCGLPPADAQSVAAPVRAFAAAAASATPDVRSANASDVLHIAVGSSLVLTSPAALSRIYVGNPAVLQTFTSGETEIVLTAKAAGVSSLVLWDEAGGHRLYAVSADLDPDGLRAALVEAFPGSAIHVEAKEGKIYLSGPVASAADSDAAVKMASIYAKDVVNSMRVVPVHGKQVQLKLRIVEVDRTRLEQFGINFFNGGRTAASTSTQQFGSVIPGASAASQVSDPLNIFLYNAKLNLGVTVKDLEQRQILQVLAEPTLTTMSGLTAQFLSGGEFPFPVVQGGTASSTAISIQFRPYGVKVEFTPTVNADGSIRLKLSPEVSTLDYSNSVTISGFTIPALSTRRAETEVEIQDGQSFVVSGLLDHRTTEIMSKVPGIANVPILGQLFRSKNFNHSIVELVILVTATVVDPLSSAAQPAASEPKFVVPNLDADAFDAVAHSKAKAGAAVAPQAKPVPAARTEAQ